MGRSHDTGFPVHCGPGMILEAVAAVYLALSVIGEFSHMTTHHQDRPFRSMSPDVNACLGLLNVLVGFAWIAFLVAT